MLARVGWRIARRPTQRLDRELDRPSRVVAVADAAQGETGPADRDVLPATSGDGVLGCVRHDEPLLHGFARITPQLSCGRVK